MDGFQVWMNARHCWALGRHWHRVLTFQNWDAHQSLRAFWTYFEMFRKGELPDALTPVAKHLFETNPGLESMSELERQAHQQSLNRIFYSG